MTFLNSIVVDGRPTTSNDKTSADRQRFIRRSRQQLKEAVRKAVSVKDMKSLENGRVRVPVKDMNEPIFQTDRETGKHERVYTGNKEFVPGDTIPRPENGGKGSGNKASDSGEGEDDFSFELTPEEFFDLLFEDMALPDLKRQMAQITQIRRKRAGFVTSGNPAQLDVKHTYKFAFARHKALGRPSLTALEDLKEQCDNETDPVAKEQLLRDYTDALARKASVPLIDDIDLRYRNYPPKPEPITKAVMVAILDVSGSMDEHRKDLAKRFFLLLYVWLMKQYEGKVEIVYLRHTTTAKECSEEEFFTSRESGGTVVSPALELADQIIRERYPASQWNAYVCQSSDGDNWFADNEKVAAFMPEFLSTLQYYAYLQVGDSSGYNYEESLTLWAIYQQLMEQHGNLRQVKANKQEDIWPVFRELFSKETA